jgi:FkbM family methyltransferase
MTFPNRPLAFVLASTNHGSLIVNRNDCRMFDATRGFGVGYQIFSNSGYEAEEVTIALALLDCRRRHFGDGVVAVDGGANIGVHTIEWARHMHGWGSVLAFEAQEVVFYALAGNIAINNCLNARARLAALGETRGEMAVPQPDYFAPASFGSLALRPSSGMEFIGQHVSYAAIDSATVPLVSLDSLKLGRVDLVKIDVEGMEQEVLRGAREVLTRERPMLIVEVIKSDRNAVNSFCDKLGYRVLPVGNNLLAIHGSDPMAQRVWLANGQLTITR